MAYFVSLGSKLWLQWQLNTVAIDLIIMGKMKISIYCYVTADILTNVLQKCSLSSPLPNVLFLSKPLNLTGCHGNRKTKFAKKKKKSNIISSEAIRGIKVKLC